MLLGMRAAKQPGGRAAEPTDYGLVMHDEVKLGALPLTFARRLLLACLLSACRKRDLPAAAAAAAAASPVLLTPRWLARSATGSSQSKLVQMP